MQGKVGMYLPKIFYPEIAPFKIPFVGWEKNYYVLRNLCFAHIFL